jgi:hypothetical protein
MLCATSLSDLLISLSAQSRLVLHDGPGSGRSPGSRRPFDPNVYRLVLFEGHVNKQIASDLDIRVKTADRHRQHLMEKLHIHEIAGLTRYTIAAGVIESRPHHCLTIAAIFGDG